MTSKPQDIAGKQHDDQTDDGRSLARQTARPLALRSNPTPHVSSDFDQSLGETRNQILIMGGLVEQQLLRALEALDRGDTELAEAIVESDREVNALEVKIDEQCTNILALRQPVAVDLRTIVVFFKVITDLERIGDEAKRIARQVAHMRAASLPPDLIEMLKSAGTAVTELLHHALDRFARMSDHSIDELLEDDRKIDRLCDEIAERSLNLPSDSELDGRRLVSVIWYSRSLERIGDHAKNIAQYLVYMVEGQDVRHVGVP